MIWRNRAGRGEAGQLTSLAVSWTALSTSLALTSSSLATRLSAFSCGLLQRLFKLALADDDQGGLPVVDDVPELLDVGPGHAPPQVAAHPADRRADQGGADDRRREQDADHGAGGRAAPRSVPGGHLVLVDVYLAAAASLVTTAAS